MDYREGFKGPFATAIEIGASTPTLTINEVELQQVEKLGANGQATGVMKDRLVVFFAGVDRGLLLNRTNAECLVGLWGKDTASWVGHKVTLHTQTVQVGPKKALGIRVLGSPELTAPTPVEIKLPRRKAFTITLQPTGQQ